jgi:glycosyltransferase involved in cell wall biosynthesis
MSGQRTCHFLLPGDWDTPTGGYTYDRRLAQALRNTGWTVEPLVLEGAWPWPAGAQLEAAATRIAALPDGALVVADGLAFGALPDVVRPHADRLRWVALVHHPLHLETGLDAADSASLLASETRALQLVHQVIVVSHSTARDVAAMGVRLADIAVVEPGTDPAPPSPAPARPAGPVQLLCVATLTPRKGHAVLLQALAGLAQLPWALHLVGSAGRDPATASLVHGMAAALGGRVVCHGEIPGAELHAHYAAADVFVLPSLYEGYGMVVAEALAHGLPVVTTDGGALAHTLPPAAGLQVPAGDMPALQTALERVLTDVGLRERLAAGARAAAAALPTWPQQAARFASVLEGVA